MISDSIALARFCGMVHWHPETVFDTPTTTHASAKGKQMQDLVLENHGGQNDYQNNSWKKFNLQSHKQKISRMKNRVRGWQPVILKIRNYSRVW